jgi:hypothetical protein
MQRRHFITTTASVGAAFALPMSSAWSSDAPARFALLRATGAHAGARFVPHHLAQCDDCAAPELRIVLGQLQPADGSAVLDRLSLDAMFQTPDGAMAPFHAWHHQHGSHAVRFIAPRDSMRSFELDYAAGNGPRLRETLALTRFEQPLLMPGDYVLVGPRRGGSAVRASSLVHSGDAAAPLGQPGVGPARDFDYVTLRMELPA